MAAVVFFAAVVLAGVAFTVVFLAAVVLAGVAFLAAVVFFAAAVVFFTGAAAAVLCRPLALPVLGSLRGSATTVLNDVPGLNFGTVVLRIRTA